MTVVGESAQHLGAHVTSHQNLLRLYRPLIKSLGSLKLNEGPGEAGEEVAVSQSPPPSPHSSCLGRNTAIVVLFEGPGHRHPRIKVYLHGDITPR